jgi:hypothetical protein
LEVIWLVDNLRPGYKTIANFRKDNSAALKAITEQPPAKAGGFV